MKLVSPASEAVRAYAGVLQRRLRLPGQIDPEVEALWTVKPLQHPFRALRQIDQLVHRVGGQVSEAVEMAKALPSRDPKCRGRHSGR